MPKQNFINYLLYFRARILFTSRPHPPSKIPFMRANNLERQKQWENATHKLSNSFSEICHLITDCLYTLLSYATHPPHLASRSIHITNGSRFYNRCAPLQENAWNKNKSTAIELRSKTKSKMFVIHDAHTEFCIHTYTMCVWLYVCVCVCAVCVCMNCTIYI